MVGALRLALGAARPVRRTYSLTTRAMATQGVEKKILKEGTGAMPQSGQTVRLAPAAPAARSPPAARAPAATCRPAAAQPPILTPSTTSR